MAVVSDHLFGVEQSAKSIESPNRRNAAEMPASFNPEPTATAVVVTPGALAFTPVAVGSGLNEEPRHVGF